MIIIVAIVVALIWHFLLERMWPSTIGSTITSTIVSFTIFSSHIGWLDKTFYKNIAIILAVSFSVSLIIGILFTAKRKSNEKAKT